MIDSKVISVSVPNELFNRMEDFTKKNKYITRSRLVQEAVDAYMTVDEELKPLADKITKLNEEIGS